MANRPSTGDRGLRPPRIRTSMDRPSTAPQERTPASPAAGQTRDSLQEEFQQATKTGHQRFVLTDPVAFRYLEEDPSTQVLEQRSELEGYECYIVEQWTTSRTHPTFVITTYTGDPENKVVVGVLSVPTDESTWSPRLRVYFKALNQYHARRRETPLGILMVTNLSGFPSGLTVVSVPDGDLKRHRYDFFVNENLKRLGCAGRVGLTLATPSSATVAKFHQLYRTSDKNEIYQSVIELVKMCQSALMLFYKLEIDYADGLLCDVTERAINDWWVEMGSGHYNVEPHDGILGPTTVAGLLGLLMGARNRLHALGAPVSKDPFDVEGMKRGISAFQKQQHMTRTRRLDSQTLKQLHKASAKHASGEGWSVPRVVKSTMAELSGKGGEMVLDAVGRRDRVGIAEIETCDIEHFSSLVFGERSKWLWQGKPLKKSRLDNRDLAPNENVGLNQGLMLKDDERGGYQWTARKSTVEGLPVRKSQQYDDITSPIAEEPNTTDDEKAGMGGRLKRAAGFGNKDEKKTKSRKDGSALVHHEKKISQDDTPTSPTSDTGNRKRPFFKRSHTSPVSSPNSDAQSPNFDSITNESNDDGSRNHLNAYGSGTRLEPIMSIASGKDSEPPPSYESHDASTNNGIGAEPWPRLEDDQMTATDTASYTAPSIAASMYNDVPLDEYLPTGPETEQGVGRLLQRTVSASHLVSIDVDKHLRSSEFYPRHLSFSLAEESVLTWTSVIQEDEESEYDDVKAQLAEEQLLAAEAKQLRLAIDQISFSGADWTQKQLSVLQDILSQSDRDQEELNSTYYPYMNRVQSLQTNSEALYRDQKERMEETTKEIETLAAKLDYEMNGLKGRAEDVEAAVADFEKGIERVEGRVKDLEDEEDRAQRGWGCVVS
ncbi:hypothetical protein K431DRAFT_284928 [Polychaeton citri CBS 116435]|uniref:STB6-like N-terminal domain-containing protein n=1 Tax=Polychaeton citri CBS 116435 TaxID=1314669 RepID=A0A9P4UMJ5_9PEZI|nr:hypothetical protein K431DRAFT_284928 [Polychaeton citri CBS 116435]